MSELEERLSSILGDPEQMAQIQSLAQSLMGGGAEDPPSGASGSDRGDGLLGALLGGGPGMGSGSGPDSALLGKLGSLLSRGGNSAREQALLEAMRPYLSEKRQGKLDRAMKLTRMVKLTKLAMGELEDGETL